MTTHIHPLHPDKVVDAWQNILPYIERALERGNGDFTPEYIMGRVVDGDYQLWAGIDTGDIQFVAVTRLEYFESSEKTVCLVMWLAGKNMTDWFEQVTAEIESWAITRGCNELRIIGRPGWERVGKQEGFRKTHTILAKQLGGRQ